MCPHFVSKRDLPRQDVTVIGFDRFGNPIAPVAWDIAVGWYEVDTLNPIPPGEIAAWMYPPESELFDGQELSED